VHKTTLQRHSEPNEDKEPDDEQYV
jgi:hypothetical protein